MALLVSKSQLALTILLQAMATSLRSFYPSFILYSRTHPSLCKGCSPSWYFSSLSPQRISNLSPLSLLIFLTIPWSASLWFCCLSSLRAHHHTQQIPSPPSHLTSTSEHFCPSSSPHSGTSLRMSPLGGCWCQIWLHAQSHAITLHCQNPCPPRWSGCCP